MRIKSNHVTDADLIQAIQAGASKREQAISQIFNRPTLRRMVINFVIGHGGQRYEAEEVFSQALTEFDERVREGKLDLKTDISAYIYGICRFLWYQHKRKSSRILDLKDRVRERSEIEAPKYWNPHNDTEWKDALQKAVYLLDTLPQTSKKVLRLWMLNYPMDEIAELTGLANASAARVCKYRALQKLTLKYRNAS